MKATNKMFACITKERPTEKQIAFLEKYSQEVPETVKQATKTIGKLITELEEAECYDDHGWDIGWDNWRD